MTEPRRLAFQGAPLDAVPGAFDEVVLPAQTLRVRLTGLLFPTMRTFLLPGALNSIRRLKFIYDEHPGAEVLVVGHTDTSGSPRYNLKLSRERAEAVLEQWVTARGEEPTFDQREGFRLLALHRQGTRGEPSFNACRETCREIAYHYNLLRGDCGAQDAARYRLMMTMLVRHLLLFVSGKLQSARLGEFCCSSRPLRLESA